MTENKEPRQKRKYNMAERKLEVEEAQRTGNWKNVPELPCVHENHHCTRQCDKDDHLCGNCGDWFVSKAEFD